MTNRRTLTFSIIVAALLALCLPVIATAQGSYDPSRYPDYERDRQQRDRNGDYDDDYYRNGRYDQRYLRDSIHRLDRLAKDFERDLDRDLDRSREDGSRHEDRLNSEGKDFRRAVGDLKSRFGNGRDLNGSADQARRVLDEARRTERASRHHFDNPRLASEWSQIRQELSVIADAYGYSRYGYDDSSYQDDRYGRRRDRDDDYRRRNPNNNPWWRRLPFPY
jgi:hypothetical protein